ncbi:MAG: FCD domain-containing protein [Mesorhizobium sp.]|uniref:GntR family transcriptional regulator n=1 Tax=Mesorhizobium sp. TaxID=1871066 RepID=UPI000FE71813|nr:GntR family transcriptional regulator [Mesorhizobium sp.]RWM88753.1 MAG: FCD domain-containing protein [Mesorhizobium sp.]
MAHRTLAYEAIAEALRKAVLSKALPEGTVLLEGPIAAIFDSSRTPVKQALAKLEAEGHVRKFDGRGVLAGRRGDPLRLPVTREMLELEPEAAEYPKTFAWRGIYYDFEKTVILRAVYGAARINELALARHYGVGRTVAGDLLQHAAMTGIVVRDDKAKWRINPLDEARFRNLYEVRLLMEPAALRTAIPRIPHEQIAGMKRRLLDAIESYPAIDGSELDAIEEDLHVDALRHSENGELLEALKRTHCVLVAGKHIQRAVRGPDAVDAFMDEHLGIVEAIEAQDFLTARDRLARHLLSSSRKAAERLEAFRALNSRTEVPFVLD